LALPIQLITATGKTVMKTKRILSIGHSYVVNLNRRLVNEMARLGGDEWAVTTVAPNFVLGDLRPQTFARDDRDISEMKPIPVYFSKRLHFMIYGWQLKEILNSDWDMVHCWQEPFIFSGTQVAFWKQEQTPLVFFTDQNNSKNYPPPFNWMEQYSMERASGWISCGQLGLNALSDRPNYNKPVRIIPHGVDTTHFQPNVSMGETLRRSLGWDDNIPVIGYLGRFVPEKGLGLLMQVLSQLQLPWRALFVGTGAMEAELNLWAEQYGDRVRICTDVKHNDVPKYLNAMDMLCAPSQTAPNWKEQFGRMLVEAFACGVAVIGSDSGEIPYVIGDSGIVVGEKDIQGWINAISDLLDNPAKRAELSAKGLERAETKFSWTTIAKQHLEFFDRLING
jgi:glycosyltransferase involved in cell wall biosynthesis